MTWLDEHLEKELQQDVEDFECEDPFIDIIPEQNIDASESIPLVIADQD